MTLILKEGLTLRCLYQPWCCLLQQQWLWTLPLTARNKSLQCFPDKMTLCNRSHKHISQGSKFPNLPAFLFSALLDALQCPAWEERLERKGLLLPTLYGAVRKQPLWFVTACSKNIQRAALVPSSTNTHGLPWDEKHLAVHPEVSSSGQRHGLISACFLHSKTTLLSSDCFQLRKTNEH